MALAAACKSPAKDHGPMMMMTAPDAGPSPIQLLDVTQDAMGGLIQPGLSAMPIVVGNGAAIGDLDGDGKPDIILARISRFDRDYGGPTMLLWNKSANGRIALVPDDAFSALTKDVEVYGVAMGDYDRDGRLDVFLACQGPDHLLHNEGQGRFTDVTDAAGVRGVITDFSSSALWVDVNDDGLPDLYVSDYGPNMDLVDLCRDPNTKSRLYLNVGDGTFLDVSAQSGTENCGATFTTAAADLDGDGTLELYLANDTFAENFKPGANHLPKDALFVRTSIDDTGVPTYTNQAPARGIQDVRATMGIGLADFDNDGALDIYLSNYGATQLYLWRPEKTAYEEAAARFTLDLGSRDGHSLISWGLLPLDLDHDGALEVFVAHGVTDVSPSIMDPDRNAQMSAYYRQPAPGMPFDDITSAVGLPNTILDTDDQNPHSARGVFPADLDGDGRLDLLVSGFNEPFHLYQNLSTPDPTMHFVRIHLVGTVSAPDPVGALITVDLDGYTRITRQHTAGGLTFGHGDFIDEIGLGARTPMGLTIAWPSGYAQKIGASSVRVDGDTLIKEPEWLKLTTRTASASDPAPILQYILIDDTGSPKGVSTASVAIVRSDQKPVSVTTDGSGTYRASLPHPGIARRTRLTITVDGKILAMHPIIRYE
jgi:hypothetical protein